MDNKKMEIEKIFERIKTISKNTELDNKRIQRKGKFVIHKGSYKPKVLFIGEAGGQDEDKAGIPFVGRSGKILDKWISQLKTKSIAVINCVPIMPQNEKGGIRKPTDQEINYYHPIIHELIKELSPEKTILLGRSAEKAILGETNCLQNLEWYYNIGFIYHPSYYIRNGKDGIEDFKKIIKQKEL